MALSPPAGDGALDELLSGGPASAGRRRGASSPWRRCSPRCGPGRPAPSWPGRPVPWPSSAARSARITPGRPGPGAAPGADPRAAQLQAGHHHRGNGRRGQRDGCRRLRRRSARAAPAGGPRRLRRTRERRRSRPRGSGRIPGPRLHPTRRPRPLPTASAAVPPSPVTGPPGWRHGQAGSARRHDRHKRPGHHKDHRGRQADHHEGMPGDRYDGGPAARRDNPMARFQGDRHDGPAARRDGNPMAHHKGSRLQSPLPSAAVFPNPPAGPDRPGAGGR